MFPLCTNNSTYSKDPDFRDELCRTKQGVFLSSNFLVKGKSLAGLAKGRSDQYSRFPQQPGSAHSLAKSRSIKLSCNELAIPESYRCASPKFSPCGDRVGSPYEHRRSQHGLNGKSGGDVLWSLAPVNCEPVRNNILRKEVLSFAIILCCCSPQLRPALKSITYCCPPVVRNNCVGRLNSSM